MLTKNVLAFSFAALMSTAIVAQAAGPKSPQETVNDAPTTSSLACYFKGADGTVKWQWGLAPNSNNSWFELTGAWKKTEQTKLKKFFAVASKSDLDAACSTSQAYYKLTGYTLFAYFAADKGAGYNYPIIVNGDLELYPQY